MQRHCADVNSPYKRKCWTNSGGPLTNSYSEGWTTIPDQLIARLIGCQLYLANCIPWWADYVRWSADWFMWLAAVPNQLKYWSALLYLLQLQSRINSLFNLISFVWQAIVTVLIICCFTLISWLVCLTSYLIPHPLTDELKKRIFPDQPILSWLSGEVPGSLRS